MKKDDITIKQTHFVIVIVYMKILKMCFKNHIVIIGTFYITAHIVIELLSCVNMN